MLFCIWSVSLDFSFHGGFFLRYSNNEFFFFDFIVFFFNIAVLFMFMFATKLENVTKLNPVQNVNGFKWQLWSANLDDYLQDEISPFILSLYCIQKLILKKWLKKPNQNKYWFTFDNIFFPNLCKNY